MDVLSKDDELIETKLSSETVFKGNLLHVLRDNALLPNGGHSYREFILHPGAVIIIPILNNGNILLERQFRYPLQKVFIELPAGKIDTSEAHLTTGQRELLEETGYRAEQWHYLGCQHPCIGYSNEVIHMYLVQGLSEGMYHRDEDEALQLFEASLDECLTMIRNGEITDGKTIIALFWAEKILQALWRS